MKKIYTLLFLAFSCAQTFSQTCHNRICNGNLDSTSVSVTTSGLGDSTFVYCWHTNATDQKMEIWGSGYNGVPSYSGTQFCELNATQPATMYQIIPLTAGSTLKIGFAHRARTNPGLTDSMQISVGPQSGPYTSLGIFGDGPSAWTYRNLNYIVPSTGNYCVRFTPTYWSFGNPAIGNFLDAVTVCEQFSVQGINELNDPNSTAVYPNPAGSETQVRFDNSSNDIYSLNIFDYQGRLVRTINDINGNTVKIDRKDLNQGMYFFRLESGQKTLTGKFTFAD
jgi:hypothetical protein